MTGTGSEAPRPLRVLAIDGGGIRGVIPAMVLAEIERRSNKRISELFDLIAGTSTGGILALGLITPDPASQAQKSIVVPKAAPALERLFLAQPCGMRLPREGAMGLRVVPRPR